jgi:carboxyl-terminal processing protease
VDSAKAVEGAIDGLVKAVGEAAGDPYTTYMSIEETKGFQESISASFEGIGAEIREENGEIVIVTPIKGSPSERAGLKPNDIILEVNGTRLSGMKASEAALKIRGPKGTEAKLQIKRPGQDAPFGVTIIRDTIPLQTVYTELLPDQIGLITITKESERTGDEFAQAWEELKAKGAKGIILDLRGNPGGLLDQAVKIAEHFVPKDKLILQVKYPDGTVKKYASSGKGQFDLPVVVLVDKGSASAAEIIAGALKESAGITVVGETTFGKGTVQSTSTFSDGSSLKFTSAQWLTPNGNQIHQQGIKPDVEVKLPEYANLPYPVIEREFKQGETAPQIQIVQKMLKPLGYDPGREDGLLDEGTARALKAFQAANGLPQTGTLTPAVVEKGAPLIRNLVKQNDTQLAKGREILQSLIQKR